MAPRYRQVRLTITGGQQDIEELAAIVKDVMSHDGLQGQDWALTFESSKPFGDVGPLTKTSLGFTSK